MYEHLPRRHQLPLNYFSWKIRRFWAGCGLLLYHYDPRLHFGRIRKYTNLPRLFFIRKIWKISVTCNYSRVGITENCLDDIIVKGINKSWSCDFSCCGRDCITKAWITSPCIKISWKISWVLFIRERIPPFLVEAKYFGRDLLSARVVLKTLLNILVLYLAMQKIYLDSTKF